MAARRPASLLEDDEFKSGVEKAFGRKQTLSEAGDDDDAMMFDLELDESQTAATGPASAHRGSIGRSSPKQTIQPQISGSPLNKSNMAYYGTSSPRTDSQRLMRTSSLVQSSQASSGSTSATMSPSPIQGGLGLFKRLSVSGKASRGRPQQYVTEEPSSVSSNSTLLDTPIIVDEKDLPQLPPKKKPVKRSISPIGERIIRGGLEH